MAKQRRSDARETQRRLLDAASEVFAEKGFWETTNADICAKAEANTAAINYHFGSKENLYIAAWKHAFERSTEAHPPDGWVSEGAPIAERLRGRILSFLRRTLDPQTQDLELLHKEMACSTGLLDDVTVQALELIHRGFEAISREALGEHASDRDVRFCFMNIMDICVSPAMHMRLSRKEGKQRGLPRLLTEAEIDLFADHTTQFILGGIQAIRVRAERLTRGSGADNKSKA